MFREKRVWYVTITLLLLLGIPAYSAARIYTTMPDQMALVKGQSCSLRIGNLITSDIKNESEVEAVSVSDKAQVSEKDGMLAFSTQNTGKFDVQLKLLGIVPLKTMSVDVIDPNAVIPGGNTIGIKIHTDGILVVGISSVTAEQNRSLTPAKDAGLQIGDIITKADGKQISSCDAFSEIIDSKEGAAVEIEYVRNHETRQTLLQPVKSEQSYKIGAWVRDSTAGIGTVTFIKPDSGVYGALGHGINDVDTSQLLTVSNGTITDCSISSVEPGKKGTPGELRGVFSDKDIGIIMGNTPVGLYGIGKLSEFPSHDPVRIATRFEVKEGPATILSSIDEGEPKEYAVQIERVMTNNSDGKGMIIRVTDETLLEKTGGIVQGMSGSPILQDGKLVGAVTHVFVNDPTRGYGIFIELMMDKAEEFR